MFGSMSVENVLGMRLNVSVESVDDAFTKMRELGARGWRPGGPIPERILEFPLAMADRFDWSLIGAREFTVTDKDSGEQIPCVEYRGEVYKRRTLAADVKKKMPEAVKYSRGAHKSDPPEIVENAGGEFSYVTLAIFRGNAPVVTAFCKPATRQEPAREPQTQTRRDAPKANVDERDPVHQDFPGQGGAPRSVLSLDEYLAHVPAARRRQIEAFAAGRNVLDRLPVLIGFIAGGKPLDPRDVDALLKHIREAA